jgi:hypothetical protein
LRKLWVLVVTEGLTLLTTPEVYRSRIGAEREAERLAERWGRSRGGSADQGDGTFSVGRRRASVLPSPIDRIQEGDGLFVGLVLSADGKVAAGPHLALEKGTSRCWVEDFARAKRKTFVSERPGDDTVYRFRQKGRTFVALSSYAKAIAPFPALLEAEAPEKTNRAGYEIELSVRYTHAVLATIAGEPGLTREELEARIDEDFPNISGYRGVPVDVDWTLESVRERGSYSLKVQEPVE